MPCRRCGWRNPSQRTVNTGPITLPLTRRIPLQNVNMTLDTGLEKRHIHIMNVIRYPSDRLATLLRDQKVATMPQLKSALGTSVSFTVLRKLAPLGYRSSYSHSGTYFTLDSVAQYDERGLWSY